MVAPQLSQSMSLTAVMLPPRGDITSAARDDAPRQLFSVGAVTRSDQTLQAGGLDGAPGHHQAVDGIDFHTWGLPGLCTGGDGMSLIVLTPSRGRNDPK